MTRLEGQVPPACIRFLEETHRRRYPVYANDFSLLFKYRLLTESRESLVRYQDVTEDLANRIWNHRNDFITMDQFCDLLKTRDMTYARLSRCLFHILLGITRGDMLSFEEAGGCGYARVLGFRQDNTALLTHIKEHTRIPLITKLSQGDTLTGPAARMLELDLSAADLYESVITEKYKLPFINEYQQQIVRC